MSIKKNDIIKIKPEDEWFEKSLDYALKSWTSTFNRMGKPNPYHRIEKILIGLIAEYTVEYYLQKVNINYETYGRTKWYEEDRYDLGINGYAVDVKATFLDKNSNYIKYKFNNLPDDKYEWFCRCHGLVPLDQLNPGKNKKRVHKKEKLYVFPFVEGNFKEESNTPPLIHAFWDYKWLKKAEYKNTHKLGKLSLGYEGSLGVSSVIIYGTSKEKEIIVEKVPLTKRNVKTNNNFYQVFSIRWEGKNPDGVLKIKANRPNIKEIIKPEMTFELTKVIKNPGNKEQKNKTACVPSENNWQSAAIFNLNTYLLGWITEEDFRLNGKKFPRFTKTIEQYQDTMVPNWGQKIKELEPIKNLDKI